MEKLLNTINDDLEVININLTMSEAFAVLGCIGQSEPLNDEDEKICRGVFEKIDKAVGQNLDKVMVSASKIMDLMSKVELDSEKFNDLIKQK